jgi:hypothetical protein
MNTLNANLAAIREAAQLLPVGRRNQVLNRCDRISVLFRRQMELDTRTAAQEKDSIVEHYNTTSRIVAALISGRKLSYRDRAEFQTAEWHTRIHEAKTIIARRFPEYIFCTRWETDGKHPYKLYWIETTR